jgi:hypothetical protein
MMIIVALAAMIAWYWAVVVPWWIEGQGMRLTG